MELDQRLCKNFYHIDKSEYENIIQILEDYLGRKENVFDLKNQNLEEKTGVLGVLCECMPLFYNQEIWFERVHQYMISIVRKMEQNEAASVSLHHGFANVGLWAECLRKQFGCYSSLTEKINMRICGAIAEFQAYYASNVRVMTQDFDVITGMSGVGNYLLAFSENPDVLPAIQTILEYLVALTEYKITDGIRLPGWHVSRENEPLYEFYREYGDGYINYSLAHGSAGILAFLTNAYRKGIVIEGQKDAVIRIVKEHFAWNERTGGKCWAGIVSRADYADNVHAYFVNRQSWCSGNLSVLFFLYQAAKEMGLDKEKNQAWMLLKKSARWEICQFHLKSPIICHGHAGLSALFRKLFEESGESCFLEMAVGLLKTVLQQYDAETPYGFRNETFPVNGITKFEDNNTFLDGAAGIMMELSAWIKEQNDFERLLLFP